MICLLLAQPNLSLHTAIVGFIMKSPLRLDYGFKFSTMCRTIVLAGESF